MSENEVDFSIMEMVPQPFAVSFYHEVLGLVGELSYDNEGQLDFTGNVTESAKVFFEQVCKVNNHELDQVDRLEDAFHQVKAWCNAYPLEVFPEPNWGEARELLGESLLTRLSASNMRHVVSTIERIINECEKVSTE